MDIDRCLRRIAYDSPVSIDLDSLKALQLAFLYRVPFENLDIHLGREITLSIDSIYNKLVEQQRGGFCYECNMLFYAMLKQLGFEVSYVSASMQTAIALDMDSDHMALSVHLDHDYLVDVGNGQSCRQPLRIDGGDAEATDENIAYRIKDAERGKVMEYKLAGDAWKPRFIFDTRARRVEDFTEMCHLQQVLPECHFTRHRLATIATADGRITLMDKELSITNRQGTVKQTIESEAQYLSVLQDHFQIALPGIPSTWLLD